jgi:hypothetical protein
MRNLYYAYLDGKKVAINHSTDTWNRPSEKPVIPILATTKNEQNMPQLLHYYRDHIDWIFGEDMWGIKEKSYLWTEVTGLTINEKYLNVHLKVGYYPDMKSDWVAVQLSNTPISPRSWGYGDYSWIDQPTEGIVRWRFIITGKGNGLVERQTSAGREIVNSIQWKHSRTVLSETYNSTHYYEAVFEIPRNLFSLFKDTKSHLRINFIRHYQWGDFAPRTKYYSLSAGDIFLMPEAVIVRKNQ